MQRIKAIIPILIPLLISSVRRAYDLAEAMESRCYNGGKNKTSMKQLHIKQSDIISLSVSLLFCASVIVLNLYF
jgi:energy-coupling factor transport system permease protein